MATDQAAAGPTLVGVDLDPSGTTCASCAHRIDRKLNSLGG